MTIRLSSYVCGNWNPGEGAGAPLYNPATDAVLAEATTRGIDMGAVLAHARREGVPALGALSFGQRAQLLKDLAKLFHTNREELLDLAQQNGGNTRGDAKFDVDGAIGTLAAYAESGAKLGERCGGRTALTDGDFIQLTRSPRFVGQHLYQRRPGVAVQVNAFNFPAWGTFEKVAVAFLAGVPVISKPATATALLTWRMTELMAASGKLPAGAFQLICGSAGDLLDRLGPMDHLAFTGSAATGNMLRGGAALLRNSVRVNVEADSLNALALGPDVEEGSDLWQAALRTVQTDMTQKTGQKCTAIRRVLVPADRIGAFGEALADRLASVKVGDPLAPAEQGVTMGPVATKAQQRDVLAGLRKLAEEADLICGSLEALEPCGAGVGCFVAPTVLAARAGAQAVHDLEVFGPACTLIGYGGGAAEAAELLGRGQGSLVSTAVSDDRGWLEGVVTGAGPWLGRLQLLSSKIADQALAPGMVLPSLVHGGPGRAGGGEELGGERGLLFYMQRTAIQADQVVLKKILGME